MALLALALLAGTASGVVAQSAAEQPEKPAIPPASGSTSQDLEKSGGVVKPPENVDPGFAKAPPPSAAKTPIVPPPGTPGGNPEIQPK